MKNQSKSYYPDLDEVRLKRFLSRHVGSITLLISFFAIIIPFFLIAKISPNGQVSGKSIENYKQLDGSVGQLWWFIQIGDLHLSDIIPTVKERFAQFCSDVVPAIDPSIVICVGDLVDSKPTNRFRSAPIEEQWIYYQNILKENDLFNGKIPWIDLPGNHDTYGVSNLQNYLKYGTSPVTGIWGDATQTRVFNYTVSQPWGDYAFVLMDNTPTPGANYPLNFFGWLPDHQVASLSAAVLKAKQSEAKHVIVAGHYPGSFIDRESYLRSPHVESNIFADLPNKADSEFVAYLQGHLHMRDLYRRESAGSGFLELEVADFKEKSAFRVFAFDSDILSFSDAEMYYPLGDNANPSEPGAHHYPLVVITNPKDARFLTDREPLDLMANSTHIRALIFTGNQNVGGEDQTYLEATAWIDKTLIGPLTPASDAPRGHPLHVLQWDSSQYRHGLHSIRIEARVIDRWSRQTKYQRTLEQYFSLDGTLAPVSPAANIILSTGGHGLLWAIFFVIFCIGFVVLLVLPKLVHFVLKRKNRFDEWELRAMRHVRRLGIRPEAGFVKLPKRTASISRQAAVAEDQTQPTVAHGPKLEALAADINPSSTAVEKNDVDKRKFEATVVTDIPPPPPSSSKGKEATQLTIPNQRYQAMYPSVDTKDDDDGEKAVEPRTEIPSTRSREGSTTSLDRERLSTALKVHDDLKQNQDELDELMKEQDESLFRDIPLLMKETLCYHIWRYGRMPWDIWIVLAVFGLNMFLGVWFFGEFIQGRWGMASLFGVYFFDRKEFIATKGDVLAVSVVPTIGVWLLAVVFAGSPTLSHKEQHLSVIVGEHKDEVIAVIDDQQSQQLQDFQVPEIVITMPPEEPDQQKVGEGISNPDLLQPLPPERRRDSWLALFHGRHFHIQTNWTRMIPPALATIFGALACIQLALAYGTSALLLSPNILWLTLASEYVFVRTIRSAALGDVDEKTA